ncbi:MAG: SDR family oxidoreductase [Bacteroidales bacterium]|nr:SDR family oxidoreductase [Bacteroidales bacterium]
MNQLAIITGAASGIGRALAEEAAGEGYTLLLADIDREGLQRATKQLSGKFPLISLIPMTVDLTLDQAVKVMREKVEETGLSVGLLINCAGFGVHGPFEQTPWNRERDMIYLHILTASQLIKEFLPGMIEKKEGRILNVASMAGFVPGPLMAVYYASKAYLISLSRALSAELKKTGVTVTVLCPGVVKTGFSRTVHGATAAIAKSKSFSSTSEEVARYAFRAMKKGKVVAIPGLMNKMFYFFQRLSPGAFTASMVKHTQQKIRRSVQT